MTRRLRLLSMAFALGFVAACASPSAPDIPSPNDEDPDDPSQDVRVGLSRIGDFLIV